MSIDDINRIKAWLIFQMYKYCRERYRKNIISATKEYDVKLDYVDDSTTMVSNDNFSAILDFDNEDVDGDKEIIDIAQEFYYLLSFDALLDIWKKLPLFNKVNIEFESDGFGSLDCYVDNREFWWDFWTSKFKDVQFYDIFYNS